MLRTACVALLAFLTACTHTLELTSEPSRDLPWQPVDEPVRLVIPDSNDPMVDGIVREMLMDSRVDRIGRPGRLDVADPDYIVDVRTETEFDADDQNFWITFPGFLLWTHAWMGYKYHANVQTTSEVRDPEGKTLSKIVIETPYEMRYTSFPRGASASLVGWLTPGFGVLAVIPGGMFASDYDDRGTGDFEAAANPSYSAVVASRILQQIAELQPATAAQPAPASDAEPPSSAGAGVELRP